MFLSLRIVLQAPVGGANQCKQSQSFPSYFRFYTKHLKTHSPAATLTKFSYGWAVIPIRTTRWCSKST